MVQGSQGTPGKTQTGTARRRSKHESRERRAEMVDRASIIIDTRPLMTLEDAARWLGVSRQTIGRWIDDGELRAVAVGQRRKLRPADIDAYLMRFVVDEPAL
jgi:excisionase family DNA binding protein